MIVPCGVGSILEALAAGLKDKVLLNRRATLVDWSLLSRDPRILDKVMVEVETPAGSVEDHYADYVVVTIPVGALKKCQEGMFYPALPQEKASTDNQRFT